MKKESALPAPSVLNLDKISQAFLGRLTLGISPASIVAAYFDWLIHLAMLPGKNLKMAEKALNDALQVALYAVRSAADPSAEPVAEGSPLDRRFSNDKWALWPFNVLSQSFLSVENWWKEATTKIAGVSCHHEDVVSFVTRQLLDICSPSNFPFTNPEILQETICNSGANLLKGMVNFAEDWERAVSGKKPVGMEAFKVGVDVALTPGKVVFRNRLIELIQYAPVTDDVFAEPVLIIPAWIMKYYILDLSPHNSLVKYLVRNGHTVFIISWRNPGTEDRDLGMEDYRLLGIMDAIKAVGAIVPATRIHAAGYCIGGTLLTIAASAMGRDNDDRLKTVTIFAGEADFTEAGELMVFIDESQVTYLEHLMWEQGYLDAKQMAGAFQLLRSNDLIWSRLIHDYLLGKRQPMFDLMAWNADTTRMPYRMHSEYLRKLFLNNDLAQGHYMVNEKPITISDIRAPIFAVGTEKDHVAPWRSVYKIHLFAETEVTFVLTSGGHNAGVVSEPGHPRRKYRIGTKGPSDNYTDPESWKAATKKREGSWWVAWQKWLAAHSDGVTKPPEMGSPERGYPPLEDAPGTYVLQE